MEKENVTPLSDSILEMEEGPKAREVPQLEKGFGEPALPRWRLVTLIFCLCFGLFLSLLDTTIVATALYTIGVDLKTLGSSNWVALAYTLSYLGCAVIFARVADVVGRRNGFIAAFIIFFAFSLGCGFSQTLNQLIACRALQGVGGAGLYSLTFVILPEISSPKMAAKIGALAGAVVAMAGVLGPVLGGIVTHYTTWRWVFWINAPMGIIPFILFIIAWPSPQQLRPAQLRSWKQLDIIGATLIIAASVLTVFSFQEAGLKPNSWRTAIFIAPLIIGCLGWLALFGWEILVNRFWENSFATMFPLRLMKRRVYMGHALSTLLIGFPYFMVIYSLPLRIQVVNGKSQLIAGVSLLPSLGSIAIASTVAGAMNSKKDRIFLTLLIGSVLMVIGTACLSTLSNVAALEPKMFGFQIFVGLGFGLMVSTVSLGASLECLKRDTTVAQGIIAQARVLGGSIGIAASTAILGIKEHAQLTGIVTPEQLATLQSSALSMTREQIHAVRQAYSDSFSEGMIVCSAISAACVLATLLTYRKQPLDLMGRRKEQAIEHMKFVQAVRESKASSSAEESPVVGV